jgi:hypothetical protein
MHGTSDGARPHTERHAASVSRSCKRPLHFC